MTKRLGKFELPKRLTKVENKEAENCAIFIAEPFESGYGHTIGNSLRRVLLSSIEGAAISSVKIEGVRHEFQSIDGVVEDTTSIILNLKKVLIKSRTKDLIHLTIKTNKEGVVRASDICKNNKIEIINPNQIICTLSKERYFYAELTVRTGRGYCQSDDNKSEIQAIGVISIDSLFSPVQLVKYSVENTRVGQMTDYDKLIFEVTTDGRITPDEAIYEASIVLKHHLDVFLSNSTEQIEFETEKKEISEEQNRLKKLLNMSVNEIELSVRAANCLNNANITTVGELTIKSEYEMLKYRNFGKKSLNEIKKKLEQLGLSLGVKTNDRLIDDVDGKD